jgi:hypothetical protein
MKYPPGGGLRSPCVLSNFQGNMFCRLPRQEEACVFSGTDGFRKYFIRGPLVSVDRSDNNFAGYRTLPGRELTRPMGKPLRAQAGVRRGGVLRRVGMSKIESSSPGRARPGEKTAGKEKALRRSVEARSGQSFPYS